VDNNSLAYDLLSKHYRSYSQTRGAYLDTVDAVVIEHISDAATSLLDVGAGDGFRAWRIARARQIQRLTLAEPNHEMNILCRQHDGAEVWNAEAENLPESGDSFDVITCLWNVLGHVRTSRKRLLALRKMRTLLHQDGLIFLDVNNRYNAESYGWARSFARGLYDLICPSETNGEVSFVWHVGGEQIQSIGHVFSPREVEALISQVGLRVRKRYVISYETGEQRRYFFLGQLLYVLEKSS
jgi:2-polyprenyl-3-methyl-5-hydroxy-6-metoxy-1,4-benzoquinol methylase